MLAQPGAVYSCSSSAASAIGSSAQLSSCDDSSAGSVCDAGGHAGIAAETCRPHLLHCSNLDTISSLAAFASAQAAAACPDVQGQQRLVARHQQTLLASTPLAALTTSLCTAGTVNPIGVCLCVCV